MRYATVIELCESPKYGNEENILKLIYEDLPNCAKQFDNAKMKLYSDAGLRKYVKPEDWRESLAKSRWYGPFL